MTAEQARAELARRELARRGKSPQESSFQELNALRGKPTGQQIWQGLQVPQQMAQRGLNDISRMMPNPPPTGNLPMDILKGTPKIMADTAAQVAPGFVSRGALMGQAAAPALSLAGRAVAPAARGIASGLEDWSGIRPAGSLREAAKDASLIFAKGKDAAGKFYKAEPSLGEGNLFSGMYKPEEIVDTAKAYLRKGGKLEPSEGFMYRKAVDSLAKSGRYVKDELFAMRKEADAIAKSSENIAAGDVAEKRGMMANSLRSLFPKNVGGRASPFKVGEALALSHMGPMGKAASVMFSPAALGAGATVGGMAGRAATNPGVMGAVSNPDFRGRAAELLRKLRENIAPQ